MENFIVSARKYRPDIFRSVVGQDSITTTLKNAIRTNHLAQAYLFCGPRGVGKTTCARIFAKTINCKNLSPEIEACNQCDSCKSFNEARAYNIHELDAASNNSVDDIRSLIDQVRIPPQVGKYSIYIIDEVHMLSTQAFNAFLKTLEEPPKHAIFILATTEKHKIIPTILSRCQIFDFNRIRVDDAVKYLEYIAREEKIEYEIEGLNIIAQKADGAMRDALSIFDQVVSFSDNKISYQQVIENLNVLDYEYYFRLTEAFVKEDVREALLIFDEILDKGFDAHNFINGLSSHFRDLLVCRDPATLRLFEVGESIRNRYQEISAKVDQDFLYDALTICNDCDINYRISKNKRLHVEFALIRLSRIKSEKKKSGQLKKQEAKEKKTKEIPAGGSRSINSEKGQDKVQVLSKPLNATPSIKEGLSKGLEKKEAEQAALPKVEESTIATENTEDTRVFTAGEVKKSWLTFAENYKNPSPRMKSTIKNLKPELLEDNVIQIALQNSAQMDDFNQEVKPKLTAYFQREFKNNLITVDVIISESNDNQEKKLYTAQDKFKFLTELNPALVKMKQQLNLDFE